MPTLADPLTIRGVTFRNRIGVSPMCQYCAADGLADDWHVVHLGSRAAGGAALVFAEATAVTPEGRITPGDVGIWSDRHADRLGRAAAFIAAQGAVPGIQLAHAGRKASCAVPQAGGRALAAGQGGWQAVAPSPIPFRPEDPTPRELTPAEIEQVAQDFEAAARRALRAGFEVLELHAAHGYLINEFLSPLTNTRTDDYGGSFDNRTRFLLDLARRLRALMPDSAPLWVRISATDYAPGGWSIDDSVALAERLKAVGVDVVDASSGAVVADAKIDAVPGYQLPAARRMKHEAGILTAAVGLITEPAQADHVLTNGDADFVLVGRAMLRDPYWALHALEALGQPTPWPNQYGYAVKRGK